MTSKALTIHTPKTSFSLHKAKKCIQEKLPILMVLVIMALQIEVNASERRGYTEDFLFARAHEGLRPYVDTGHYSSIVPTNSKRPTRRIDTPQPSATSLVTQIASIRISPSLPSISLKETSFDLQDQNEAKVPILKSPPIHLYFSVNNEFYKKFVGNQLQLGTCASFAVVDCLLYLHNNTLSPAYLNVKAKSKYALDCTNDGLNIGLAMTCAKEYGTVMDWLWPYQGYYFEVEEANKYISNEPQPNWDVCIRSPYTDEEDKGLVKFSFEKVVSFPMDANTKEKDLLLRDALITYKTPIVVSIPVKWNDEWLPNTPNTGKIKSLIKPNDKIDGWHAISICGFNDDTQEFTFKNSWGLEWGNGGYGTLTYKYFSQHVREAWTGIGKQLKS